MRPPSKTPRSTRAKFETLENRQFLSASIQIPATSDPWILGGLTGAGAGTAPISVALGSGSSRVVTFPSVTGMDQGNDKTSVFAGPDGFTTNEGTQNLLSVGAISGFVQNGTLGDFALIGVFTGNSVPKTVAPTRLQYNGPTTGIHYSPQLDQVFYIGDGRAGTSATGALQQFNVPAGATHLYLGLPDGTKDGTPGFYNDNGGALTATVNVSGGTVSNTPVAVSGSVLKDVSGAAGPGMSGVRVYVDAGKDGRFDPSDPNVLTNSSGDFTLSLSPGTYTIGVEPSNGYCIASPSSFNYTVTVSSSPVTGLKFILKPMTASL